jgi:hypothetical protein
MNGKFFTMHGANARNCRGNCQEMVAVRKHRLTAIAKGGKVVTRSFIP